MNRSIDLNYGEDISQKPIAIIDYGMGNLESIKNALEYLGATATISDKPDLISKSNFSILPGVGSYKTAMKKIREKKIDEAATKAKSSSAAPQSRSPGPG